MASVENVLLPDIGDFNDVEVIEILVAPGDSIEPEQSLLSLESDKATMEIPSPIAGTVKELKVSVGDRISKDTLLMVVETAGNADGPAPAAAPEPSTEQAPSPPEEPAAPASAPSPAPAASAQTASATPAAEASPIEIKLPDIGDFADVPPDCRKHYRKS